MFYVKKIDYRPWPVTVVQRVCDTVGNVVESENTFVAHFKPFSEAEFVAIVDQVDADLNIELADRTLSDNLERNARLFPELIVGWGDEVRGEFGNPLPFTRDLLAEMVTGSDGLSISIAINKAIEEIRFGIGPRKNLTTSPQPGQTPALGEAAPVN